MSNSVYSAVCEALSQLISKRAAQNIVNEALAWQGLKPESVNKTQMRSLLMQSILPRLEHVIPVAVAQREVRNLLENWERVGETPINTNKSSIPQHDPAPIAPLKLAGTAIAEIPAIPKPSNAPTNPPLVDPDVLEASVVANTPPTSLEFETPAPSAPPRETAAPRTQHNLSALIALEDGVLGILWSDRMGEVIDARMNVGQTAEPVAAGERLAEVTAAITYLLEKNRFYRVFYLQMNALNVLVAPFGDVLLTIVTAPDINLGRLLGILDANKEEAA